MGIYNIFLDFICFYQVFLDLTKKTGQMSACYRSVLETPGCRPSNYAPKKSPRTSDRTNFWA